MKAAIWQFGFGLLVALVASPTSVGAWTYEQIDTVGNWSWVELEVMSTGTVCVCYRDAASGHIFVARKDSIWHRDDLGEWNDTVGHHLVKGPAGKPTVLLKSDTITVYTILTDTGWDFTTVHCTTGYTFLAFDSSGNPALLYYYGGWLHCLASAYEQGGVWTTDIIHRGYYDGLWWNDPIRPTTFVLGPGNRFYDDRGYYQGFTMGGWWLYVDTGRTGAWSHVFMAGAHSVTDSGVSMSPGPSSDFAVCYNMGNWGDHQRFYCNGEVLETLPAGPGRIRVDARSQRQIVYRLGVLKYAYRTGVWHIDTLPPEINAAASFDFAIDAEDMPLIAFSTENGIFLATGDAVGVTEKTPQKVREPLRLPTIVCGVLNLPLAANRLPSAALLDISGRKVFDLQPGPNDVSRLPPGAYFIRLVGAGIPTVRRIVVLR
jgi:hypothetical protein